jgi:hypothetical protein
MISWLHLASESFSPPAFLSSDRECLVVAMGAGAKIVCAFGYDHFSAIRSVFDAPLLPVSREMARGVESIIRF